MSWQGAPERQPPLRKCDFYRVRGIASSGALVSVGALPGGMPSPAADRDPFAISNWQGRGNHIFTVLGFQGLGVKSRRSLSQGRQDRVTSNPNPTAHPAGMGEAKSMSRKSMSARHRATPTQSIALQGLSHSLKSNAS